MNIIYAVFLLTVFLFSTVQGDTYRRVCYYTDWAKYRPGVASYRVANLEPFLCTHIVFAFGTFDTQGTVSPFDPSGDLADYSALSQKRQVNTNLKLLLAFGGWNFGSVKFSNMAANPSVRSRFISNVVIFIRRYGFDGLDIDWEYPGSRGGASSDKANFVTLCKELVDAFKAESRSSGKTQLLLATAVPANRNVASIGYDIRALNQYLDIVSLMTYDFHGGWDRRTGFNSPLYSGPGDISAVFNIDSTAKWWHGAGISKDKITVGFATYGRSFTLSRASESYLGAPATTGPAGRYTREGGFWSYYEVCQKLASGQGRVVFDNTRKVPYFVDGTTWVGYDNEQSMAIKAQWLKDNGYGGVMFWALDLDDFGQICPLSTQRTYPLINTVKDILEANSATSPTTTTTTSPTSTTTRATTTTRPTTTTQRPTTATRRPTTTTRRPTTTTTRRPTTTTTRRPTTTTTRRPTTTTRRPTTTTTRRPTTTPQSGVFVPTAFSCIGRSYAMYPDPFNCGKFIWCTRSGGWSMPCPGGLVWDRTRNYCNYRSVVNLNYCIN